MSVLFHMTPAGNVPAIKTEGLRAQTGERSLEAEEAGDAVYLFRTLQAAEDGLGGWFGECFDEETALTLLAVDLYIDIPEDETSFEIAIAGDIPASAVTVLCEDVDQVRSFETLRERALQIGPLLGMEQDEEMEP